MKILRVFGVVVGIHLFAFLVIFANPGCSSTNKPAPNAADTVAKGEPPPVIAAPMSGGNSGSSSPISAAPMSGGEPMPTISFNAPAASGRYSPTRPGTTAATALEATPVADVTPASTYTVVGGDSLSVIAKRNKITTAELAAANNIRITSPIQQGQKLIIPSKNPLAPATAATPAAPADASASRTKESASGEVFTHTVKSGETLGAIARKYGMKPGDLAVANNITDPAKIRPGQELIIKGGQAAKPAAGGSAASPVRTAVPASSAPRPAASAPAPAPVASQDLDAGLRSSSSVDIPVIKVEEAPPAK